MEELSKSRGRAEEESRKSRGRVQEESRKSPGRVEEESRKSRGRVEEESRKSLGRVEEESRKSRGRVEEEPRISRGRVKRKSQGRVEEGLRKSREDKEKVAGRRKKEQIVSKGFKLGNRCGKLPPLAPSILFQTFSNPNMCNRWNPFDCEWFSCVPLNFWCQIRMICDEKK